MSGILEKNFALLRTIFQEVLEVKNSGNDNKADLLAEKRTNAALLFVVIKKVSRTVKYQVRAGREELNKEKLTADSNWLQFQNLLYEVSHLKREIRYCHQFKSQDEDVDLLPQDDYLEVVRPKRIPQTAHENRLVRLESELNLRKHLSTQCKDLLNNKKQLLQEIVLKIERLTSFAPSIRTLLKATQPLQEALHMPMEQKWEIERLVQMLPQPLYLVYMNIHALKKGVEAILSVEIIGNESNLKAMDDFAGTDLEERSTTSTRFSTGRADIAELQQQRNKVLEPYPLKVKFSIKNSPTSNERIDVTLHYFKRLEIMTASTNIILNTTDAVTNELTSTLNMLNHLYETDIGDFVPVFSANYLLQQLNMSNKVFLEYLNLNSYGRPYRWVQEMCCIDAYEISRSEEVKVKLQKCIQEVIKRIQTLWSNRLCLISQIRTLASKNLDKHWSEESLPQTRPTCSLVQWTSVTPEEYAANSSTAQYSDADLFKSSVAQYRAVVVRGSAKMECLVSIPYTFPLESPIWTISVHWNGQHNSLNNTAIKLMEYRTNSLLCAELKNKSALLPTQLIRTMYSFDIFLETEGPLYVPLEYHKEKHFAKPFTKRIRARPYRYIEGGTKNLFKQ